MKKKKEWDIGTGFERYLRIGLTKRRTLKTIKGVRQDYEIRIPKNIGGVRG